MGFPQPLGGELIQTLVENQLYGLFYDTITNHKDGLKLFYNVDYQENPNGEYFVYFLVFMIFTSFDREKGKRSIEEVLESMNQIIQNILWTWGIDSPKNKENPDVAIGVLFSLVPATRLELVRF